MPRVWALDKSGTAALALSSGPAPEAGGLGARELWPALGCLLFVCEAPPCLPAKEAQEVLAENTVPCCPAEMTTSRRHGRKEEDSGKKGPLSDLRWCGVAAPWPAKR